MSSYLVAQGQTCRALPDWSRYGLIAVFAASQQANVKRES
jgi:hypothetical protein